MATTQKEIYDKALIALNQRTLKTVTDPGKARRTFDTFFDARFIKKCLAMADWNFAQREVRADADPSITPEFGLRYAFAKPSDWVKTSAISLDERFQTPLLAYKDRAGFWFCDQDYVYVSYVSDDAEYGTDFSLWPESFTDYVSAELAACSGYTITGGKADVEKLEVRAKKALLVAKSQDAMNQPPSFPPTGRWARARMGGGTNRQEFR